MQERSRARVQGLLLGVAILVGAAAGAAISYLVSGGAGSALYIFLGAATFGFLIGIWNFLFPDTLLAMRKQRERARRDAKLSLRILGSTLLVAGAVLMLALLVSALL